MSKLTSIVITNPKDWAEESYLVPHEPLRWDLIECQRMLQEKNFDGTVPWKVDAFFTWYAIFYEIVHHHHDTEETIFFPALKARAEIPDKVSKDHVGLVKMMEDIRNSKKYFDAARTTEEKKKAATDLRNLWTTFKDDMIEHLAEEERVLSSIMRKVMTEKEHQALIDKTLSTLGLSGNAMMLPWIIRSLRVWKSDAEVEKFLSVIPAPIRLLNKHFWTPAYEKNNWGLLHSIEGNTPPSSSHSLLTAAVVVMAAVGAGAFFYLRH